MRRDAVVFAISGTFFGLIAAAFDQAAMLTFYYFVEKPHYEQLTAAA